MELVNTYIKRCVYCKLNYKNFGNFKGIDKTLCKKCRDQIYRRFGVEGGNATLEKIESWNA